MINARLTPGRRHSHSLGDMTRMIRSLTLAGALALVLTSPLATGSASAAQQGQMVEPTPLAADHPLAKRAAAVADQILAGNRDAVLAAMKKDGTPELAASPALEGQVDRHIERLAKKGYKIGEFSTGRGADVIVRLTDGPEDTNIVIRFSAQAPHKLEGLAQARPAG